MYNLLLNKLQVLLIYFLARLIIRENAGIPDVHNLSFVFCVFCSSQLFTNICQDAFMSFPVKLDVAFKLFPVVWQYLTRILDKEQCSGNMIFRNLVILEIFL